MIDACCTTSCKPGSITMGGMPMSITCFSSLILECKIKLESP